MAKKQTQITSDNLAEVIKGLRTEKGLTQKGLGYASETSEPTIIRIEKGKNSPSFDNLERIFNVFDKKVYIK